MNQRWSIVLLLLEATLLTPGSGWGALQTSFRRHGRLPSWCTTSVVAGRGGPWRLYAQGDKEDEDIFFDDFEGLIGGNSDGDSLPTAALTQRMAELQQTELKKDTQLLQNWKTGNWKVRGVSLDSEDAGTEETAELQRIHVCRMIVANDDENDCLWVGRTNGQVCLVRLGQEYWTQFRSQLVAESTDESVQVRSQLVRDEDDQPVAKPFEILAQWQAHDTAIGTMAVLQQYLFTAAKDSGDVRLWRMEENDQDARTVTPVAVLQAHTQPVIALLPVADSHKASEPTLLLSVSIDGSIALWDVNGDLILSCQIPSSDGDESSTLTCVSVDHDRIYLGTATGQVLVYQVQDLIESASDGLASCPVPVGQWSISADGTAVTAMCSAGVGSLGRGGDSKSALLLTGAANGLVQQWEVLTTPDHKIQQWPKLPTQRLPKKAHLFQGHEGPVTALLAMDATKFVSAAQDGTVRAWNPATGKALFFMDGFENLTSLCFMDDTMLITDGMKNCVCVHDFDVDQDEQDFELDYEEE